MGEGLLTAHGEALSYMLGHAYEANKHQSDEFGRSLLFTLSLPVVIVYYSDSQALVLTTSRY